MVSESIHPGKGAAGAGVSAREAVPNAAGNGGESPGDQRAPGDDFVEAILQGVSIHAIAQASGLGMLGVILAAAKAVPPERVKEIREGANAILETRLMGLKFEALDRLKELAGRFDDDDEDHEGEAERGGAVGREVVGGRGRISHRRPIEITPGRARALELSRRTAVSILGLNLGSRGREPSEPRSPGSGRNFDRADERHSLLAPASPGPRGRRSDDSACHGFVSREVEGRTHGDVRMADTAVARGRSSGAMVEARRVRTAVAAEPASTAAPVQRHILTAASPFQGLESCAGPRPGVAPRADECRPFGPSEANGAAMAKSAIGETADGAETHPLPTPPRRVSSNSADLRSRERGSNGSPSPGGGRTFLASLGLIRSSDHPP